MNGFSLRSVLTALTLVLALAGISSAQAPDCSGISPVLNSDPDLLGELTAVRVASGLSAPVHVTAPWGDVERVFVVEQVGSIRLIKNGTLLPADFLNIEPTVLYGGEQGLLGLAFHPDYETNGYFFVYYTNNSGNQSISRFTRDTNNPDLADPSSEANVITVPHPVQPNHNGGMLAFSPIDGHLYIGTGDGGGGCDPGPGGGNAQSLFSNLGKLLRLNVDSLPATTTGNPYDGAVAGNDAIWAYGLRNPWRWSFDRATGAIYFGDVGQFDWEEIDCQPPGSTGGENYGWVDYEGSHCPNPSCGGGNCGGLADYSPPLREYTLAGTACAVAGGNVYRGCRMADLQGTYFYSDACLDFIRTFRTDGACSAPGGVATIDVNRAADIEPGGMITIDSIVSYGEDARGELYIADLGGEVFAIVPEISIMEMSGPNATPLLMGDDWTMEDLSSFTAHQVRFHRWYRSVTTNLDGSPGPFTCVFRGLTPAWPGGDPTVPAVGDVFYYLATGQVGTGGETSAGVASDGTPRVVPFGSVCSL